MATTVRTTTRRVATGLARNRAVVGATYSTRRATRRQPAEEGARALMPVVVSVSATPFAKNTRTRQPGPFEGARPITMAT